MIRFVDIAVNEVAEEIDNILDRHDANGINIASNMVAISRMALTRMAKSDSLYFSFAHTVSGAKVALEIIRGLYARNGFVRGPEAMNIMCSVLFCNVGIIRGILPGDKRSKFQIQDGKSVAVKEQSTDSALWKFRTDRSVIFISKEPLLQNVINTDIVTSAIQNTDLGKRANQNTLTVTDKYCRATQIISLMSNTNYNKELVRLYWSAKDGGALKDFNFQTLEEFREKFPDYFWNNLYSDAAETISLLNETDKGREIVSSLYAHL